MVSTIDTQNENPTAKPGIALRSQGLAMPFAVSQDAASQGAMQYCTPYSSDFPSLGVGRWSAHLTIWPFDQDPVEKNFCMELSAATTQPLNDAIRAVNQILIGILVNEIGEAVQESDAAESNHDCYVS